MTPHQIDLVRNSHALLAPIAPQAAGLFYTRLFAADPGLRALFGGDMVQQGQRLMDMIGAAVGLLDRPAALLPVLRDLGDRHGRYGVRAAHYDTVGAALIDTLAEGLGPAFTPATRAAWVELYGVISSTMQAGVREPTPTDRTPLAA